MARKGSKRKFRKYLKGNIDLTTQLSTLAAKTGLITDTSDPVEEKTWISSVKAFYALNNLTPSANDGPISLYVSHPDYTLVEIEEFIENAQSWSEGDLVAQEVAKRKIRLVGVFTTDGAASDANASLSIGTGKPIHTKCGWMLQTGDALRFTYYNMGGSALATTDPTATVQGHANLWPR